MTRSSKEYFLLLASCCFYLFSKILSLLFFFTEFYKSLSLGRDNVRHLRTSNEADLANEKKFEEEQNQKQILLQIEEERWNLQNQLEIAREVQKIERDSQTVNEIFRDLAKIINVSLLRHFEYRILLEGMKVITTYIFVFPLSRSS